MSRLDWKYEGMIIKSSDRTEVPEDEWILFRVTDKFLIDVLNYYNDICVNNNCSKEHLDNIRGLIDRVDEWQRRNHDRVKLPD